MGTGWSMWGKDKDKDECGCKEVRRQQEQELPTPTHLESCAFSRIVGLRMRPLLSASVSGSEILKSRGDRTKTRAVGTAFQISRPTASLSEARSLRKMAATGVAPPPPPEDVRAGGGGGGQNTLGGQNMRKRSIWRESKTERDRYARDRQSGFKMHSVRSSASTHLTSGCGCWIPGEVRQGAGGEHHNSGTSRAAQERGQCLAE